MFKPKLKELLKILDNDSWILLNNANSLIGTMVVTSGLGFLYWWIATQLFPAYAVGLATAVISAMLLFGNVGTLGFGTLLIAKLSENPNQAGIYISSGVLVAGVAGGLLGLVFIWVSPWLTKDFYLLKGTIGFCLLFSLGVSLTAIGLVMDQAVIGLLHGSLQFWRNTIHSAVKIGLLVAAGLWLTGQSSMLIVFSWAIGSLISLIVIFPMVKARRIRLYKPEWKLVGTLGRTAIEHHCLNLALMAPGLIMPVIVTALITTQVNAYFYAAWMIASFTFAVSAALTIVLYAVGSSNLEIMVLKMRMTFIISVCLGALSCLILLLSANQLLRFFGLEYAEQAALSLRILGLGVFPLIIKNHFIAVCRVNGCIGYAAKVAIAGCLIELAFASLGANVAGLTGMCLGWFVGICTESLFMTRTVLRALAFQNSTAQVIINKAIL